MIADHVAELSNTSEVIDWTLILLNFKKVDDKVSNIKYLKFKKQKNLGRIL